MATMLLDSVEPYSGPSVILFGDTLMARERIAEAARLFDARIIAEADVEGAASQLARLLSAGAVLVEVDHDPGEPLDHLLLALNEAAATRSIGSVVVVPPHLIDVASALAGDPGVLLLSARVPRIGRRRWDGCWRAGNRCFRMWPPATMSHPCCGS